MFNIFKKNKFKLKNIEYIDESNLTEIPKTNIIYNDIEIEIKSNRTESLKHINNDYEVIKKNRIEDLIKSNFIPWLKGEDFKALNDDEIYKGLKLINISYSYHKINEKYSPTNQDDFFGEFEFDFESGNSYTENLLQASAFVLLVNSDKVYYGKHHDI